DHDSNTDLSFACRLIRRSHTTDELPTTHSKKFPSTASIASTPFRAHVLDSWADSETHDLVTELSDAARQVMGPDRFKVLEGSVPSLGRAGQDTLKRWFVRGASWRRPPDPWHNATLSR